jgi:hypothetical protein
VSVLTLLVRMLAAYRLTGLVTEDQISAPLREAAGRRWPSSIGYLVRCRACTSVWVGLALSAGKTPKWIELGLAASGAVLLVDRAVEIAEGAVVAANRR